MKLLYCKKCKSIYPNYIMYNTNEINVTMNDDFFQKERKIKDSDSITYYVCPKCSSKTDKYKKESDEVKILNVYELPDEIKKLMKEYIWYIPKQLKSGEIKQTYKSYYKYISLQHSNAQELLVIHNWLNKII